MLQLHFLAPLWLSFEIVQLVLAERLLGIKQINSGQDPRHDQPGIVVSYLWSFALILYGLWMLALLITPAARPQALGLIAITSIGYMLRRNAKLKWILVLLTFEGSLRVGMLVSLSAVAWRSF